MTIDNEVGADDVTIHATVSMTAGRQVLNNCEKVLLLNRRQRLEEMRQMRMQGDVGCIWQHILVCLIVRKDKVTTSKADGIKPSRFGSEVNRIMRLNALFVDFIKTIQSFAFTFKTNYSKKFVVSRILDIVKEMVRSTFLTETSA